MRLNKLKKKSVNPLCSPYSKLGVNLLWDEVYLIYNGKSPDFLRKRCSKLASHTSFRESQIKLIDIFLESYGAKLIYCPPGIFKKATFEDIMREGFDDAAKIEMSIVKGFYLADVPVTQSLYEAIMKTNPSIFKEDDQRPVENLSWYDAAEFCNKLSDMFWQKRAYDSSSGYREIPGANGFRMPTAEEWEYAAKAGTENRWAGTNYAFELPRYAWWNDPVSQPYLSTTMPVAKKLPNDWGFYDMSGNVWEMCSELTKRPKADALMKGGCYSSTDADSLRIENTGGASKKDTSKSIGFRIAKFV